MDVDMTASAPSPALNLNIIRIKRKATEAPLTSLVVQEGERAAKRLRDNGPLSPAATNNGSGHGIFRLAQTVGHEWSAKAAEEAALRETIQKLMAEQKAQFLSQSPLEQSTVQPSLSALDSTDTLKSPVTETIPQERRYRVIKPAHSQGRKAGPGSRFGAKAAQIIAKPRQDFRLIDAQLESTTPASVEPVRRRALSPRPPKVRTEGEDEYLSKRSLTSSQAVPSKDSELDDEMKEMEKFLPMLTESLGLADRSELAAGPSRDRQPAKPISVPSRNIPPASLSSSQISIQTNTAAEEDGDWVYDLYYREPTDLSTLPQGANGVDAGLGPFGDGVMVGALAGLDELLDDEEDPGSDTEEGDEADEDSNEENFYRNEYPDEESPSPSSSPELFTHFSVRAQNARNARVVNGKERWNTYEAGEYYGNGDDDEAQDSEEEEKRMPDWRVNMTRLQRKLRGEERERDRRLAGLRKVPVKGEARGSDDEDEDEDGLEDMSDLDDDE
ncbi:hypothetical protein FFLO_06505 [Filobasidium floriforme]|uniref:Probable RNA polymerase II nuclear localization protein SLC7A6OS n=1 Tax=Filobasidium floriforme TaxID=5210 RepID=A0A8K0NMY7_9TREE|nr:hypothetical protein FFLO_06505 [Filobasidium floriforme]